MIYALADDLTGAAEIAGVAVRHGLTAAVTTRSERSVKADFVVVDTETRSLDARQAVAAITDVLGRAGVTRMPWAFKKVDSVLRGPVVAEVAAVLQATAFARALLVPANPGLGRVIWDGRYLIDGRPIEHTEFARDPEYPMRRAAVLEMLGSWPSLPMCLRRPGAALPDCGLIVGEAKQPEDLAQWASVLDGQTLPVGAAAFLAAVLRRRLGSACGGTSSPAPADVRRPALIVSGSASRAARQFADECDRRGRMVLRLPIGGVAWAAQEDVARWTAFVADALDRDGWVLLTLAAAEKAPLPAARASHTMLVRIAGAVLERATVGTLCVDGGATAAALINALGCSTFYVTAEYAPGVVRMQPEAASSLRIVMKPGSYKWPPAFFD